MWLALGAVVSTFTIIGIALAIPNGDGNADAKAAPIASPPKAKCTASLCIARVSLPSDGSQSTTVNLDDLVPDTWSYSFSGPPETVACWAIDGRCAPIALAFDLGGGQRGWGVRDGLVAFSAPAGTDGKVIIQSHPPR